MVGLFDNATLSGFTTGGPLDSNYESGNRFTLAEPGYVTALRWYRAATGGTAKPTAIDLWDNLTHTIIATCQAVPDSGSVGWQTYTLGATVQLAIDRSYTIAGRFTAGGTYYILPAASQGTPPLPFAWDTSRLGQAAPAPVWPTPLVGNTNTILVDVSLTVGTTGQIVPTPTPTIDNNLTAWLADTGDNTHRSADAVPGLPDRTYQDTQATKALAQGATGFDAIKAVADAISAAVGGLPGTIASAVTTITGQVISSATAITGAGLHTVGEVYDNTTTLLSHIADLMAGTSPASGSTTGRAPFPTGLWTFVDSTAFSGPLAWDVAADLYVIDVTTIPPNRPTTIGDGAPWTPRLGWWCQKNGTFFGERHFFDFPESHLQDSGRRMPGVLIWPEDGASGTIQAWVYS